MVKQKVSIPLIEDALFMVDADTGAVLGLRGMRCRDCGETFFGVRLGCENCASERLDEILLSAKGRIFSFTVLRVPPPGNYLGELPADGLVLALVELPDGLRVLAPIDVKPDNVAVGMPVTLRLPTATCNDGEHVITYAYKPSS